MCYLITPVSKQKALRLQFGTAEFHVPAMWMGCFHPPLPMHVFAEEPGLRAAPTAQGVGTDPKDLGCFGGGDYHQFAASCDTGAGDDRCFRPKDHRCILGDGDIRFMDA